MLRALWFSWDLSFLNFPESIVFPVQEHGTYLYIYISPKAQFIWLEKQRQRASVSLKLSDTHLTTTHSRVFIGSPINEETTFRKHLEVSRLDRLLWKVVWKWEKWLLKEQSSLTNLQKWSEMQACTEVPRVPWRRVLASSAGSPPSLCFSFLQSPAYLPSRHYSQTV